MKDVIIRKAKISDVEKLYDLVRATPEIGGSDDMFCYSKKEIKTWIQNPKENIWLVAELKTEKRKQIVGLLFAKLMSYDWCMIDGIGVRKNYRNYQLGTKLLQKLEKILKQRKVRFMQAYTDINNKNTHKFWKKNGLKSGKTFIWFDKKA
jgi:ribosomal protein S18 acetylase RimI-like enzyme